MGRRPLAARLFATAGCHADPAMGDGRLIGPRRQGWKRASNPGKSGFPLLPNAMHLMRLFGKSPTPGLKSVSALRPITRLASNLKVFGRGLAAIGNLFVFHGLPFIERGK